MSSTELWFDPIGSDDKPTKVLFSISQSDSTTHAYKWGGTIKRDKSNVELFSDAEGKNRLLFSENQISLTNKQLTHDNKDSTFGFVAYVRGTKASSDSSVGTTTSLSLELDTLEKSERYALKSSGSGSEEVIKVTNGGSGSSVTLTVKKAASITPTLTLGTLTDADTHIYDNAPTQVIFSFNAVANESGGTFDGDGELLVDPTTAKIELFSDAECKNKVALTDGKATIANSKLSTQAVFYLKAESSATLSKGTLSLSLLPATTDPDKYARRPATQKSIAIALVNTVTPKLTAVIDPSLDGSVWFPQPKAAKVPYVQIEVVQDHAEDMPYKGDAVLSCDDDTGLLLYQDEDLEQPLPFFDKKVVINNSDLVAEIPHKLYVAGLAAKTVKLTLTLYDPNQRGVSIAKPVTVEVTTKPVNIVRPKIAYAGAVSKGELTAMTLGITESNPDAPYDKSATLTRASTDLVAYGGKSETEANTGTDPLFGSSSLTTTRTPDELRTGGPYYATWGGSDAVEQRQVVAFSFTFPESSKPYIIVDESAQLMVAGDAGPEVTVAPSTTVTPTIVTEYDLVLKATADTEAETRTRPTRAKFYAARTNEDVAYLGTGTLTRSSEAVRVFFDDKCTVEMNFNNGSAVISNADLLNSDKVYYLQGAAAGETELKLTLAKRSEGFPALPAIIVGEPVTKTLGVLQLDLTVYRDAGEIQPNPTSNTVALSHGDQQTRGRFVHVQSSDMYGRAKLSVEKVNADHWPSSASKHQVQIAVTSDKPRIKLYDSGTGTTVAATTTSPATYNRSAATSNDIVLYAQGEETSDDLNDVKIDVGVSRTDVDTKQWKDTKALSYGDWAAMTSVEIKTVAPAAETKQYVNLPRDPDTTTNDGSDEAKKGQQILITATVDPPKANIGVDFMLWGFDGNGDAASTAKRVPLIPDEMKASDKHVTSLSLDSGASARVKLSRYGGDAFYATAFLADDAAKGQAASTKTTAPTIAKSGKIVVWRKIFYTLAAMKRRGNNAGDYSARANPSGFEAQFTSSFIEMEQKGSTALIPHQLTITKTAATTLSQIPAPAERTANVVLLDTITRSGEGPRDQLKEINSPSSDTPLVTAMGTFDTSDFLKPNSGVLWNTKTNSKVADIPDSKFSMNFYQQSLFAFGANITGLYPSSVARSDLKIIATLKELHGPSGFTSGVKPFVAVRNREQIGALLSTYDPTASCVHTMGHEMGHYLGLTAETVPRDSKLFNAYWYEGRDSKTTYNQENSSSTIEQKTDTGAEIGLGSHCKWDRTDYDQTNLKDGKLPNGSDPLCIMFHQLTIPVTTSFCDSCVRSLKGRDLSVPPLDGSDSF